ncbi:hypothetical protein RJ640_001052, partial [Escallonia rubra]
NRGTRLLIAEQFPHTAYTIISFRVDYDILSLDGKGKLKSFFAGVSRSVNSSWSHSLFSLLTIPSYKMSSPSYGNTNTEASDSVARRGWLIPADSARVLDVLARWATTLVGKLVDIKKFSTRRVLQREVQAGGFIQIERAKGLYLFHFEREDAKDLFVAGSPWKLCGALVILMALIPNTPLHEHRFDEIAVWIQLHRFPYEYFNEEDATLIARAAGPMVAVDWPPDGNRKYDYIRVRVRIYQSFQAGHCRHICRIDG